MAKKGKVNMGSYMPDELEFKAYHWCINNNIYISPFAHNTFQWYVDIVIKGKLNRSPKTFEKIEIWEMIFKYYKYYYEKYEQKI